MDVAVLMLNNEREIRNIGEYQKLHESARIVSDEYCCCFRRAELCLSD